MNTLVLNRRRTSLWGVLAVIAAVVTALSVYSYLSFVRSQVPVAGKLVPMVVAALDVDPGSTISADMVELVDHPGRYLPAGALSTVADAIGRTAAVPIFKGEPVTSRKVAAKGGLSSVVPAGMRAYSLSIAAGSTLNFVPRTSDRVDVIVTFPREVLGEARAITVLRFIQVASVGASDDGGSGKVANGLGIEGATQNGLAITLFVSPEEAEHLALAESLGRIAVVLSPARPDQGPPPKPVGPADLGAK